jgi:DHA1 family multidrug resistance protein-like MFS transporter
MNTAESDATTEPVLVQAIRTPLWRKPQVLRLLLIALFAEIGYAVLNISTMPVYLVQARGLGESAVGLVLTSFLLSEAIFKSPMGHLSDRYGRKMLMTVGPSITIFTALLSLAVPMHSGHLEVIAFILLRILDGVGAAMLWPGAFAAMGDAVEDNQRQQAMSLLNVCYLIGVALALPLGGIVNDASGVKWASLVLASVLFMAVTITAWRSLPNDRAVKHHGAVEGEPAPLLTVLSSAKQIPTYLTLAVITFAGIGFPMAVIKNFALDEFKMSESGFGLLVLPAAISMAVLSVPMSKLGEKLGRARAVHLGMGLCSGGLVFIALGAFVPFLRAPWALALGGMPVGIGFLLAIPAWMASVSDADPSKRAANLGAVMTAQGVGAIIGAPLGAVCYEKLQFISVDFARYSPFLGCAACVTGGWLLGLRILRERA